MTEADKGQKPRPAKGTVTIYDIAADAGVSFGTVSRVLNNRPDVSASTRAAVWASIERLGYVRHPLATALAARRTGLIGSYVQPSSPITGAYYSQEMQLGIVQAAAQAGRRIVLLEPPAQGGESLQAVAKHLVEGVVAGPGTPLETVDALSQVVPVVGINLPPPYLSVTIDYQQGSREATAHLLSLGHRRIAVLAGAGSPQNAEQRLAGYHAALEEHGQRPASELIVGSVADLEEFYTHLRRLVSLAPPPTAFFVGSDILALETIRFLAERGLAVPQDVSVVGFSDLPLGSLVMPALTTVRIPLQDVGRMAVELLMQIINGADPPSTMPGVTTCLVVRDTTARPGM